MRSFLPTNLPGSYQPPSATAGDTDVLAILLNRTDEVLERLAKLEAAVIASGAEQEKAQDWYSTAAAAKFLGLAEFTVRNYCRLGRIRGAKKGSGRGKYQSWVVSHAEIERVRREGLLPLCRATTL